MKLEGWNDRREGSWYRLSAVIDDENFTDEELRPWLKSLYDIRRHCPKFFTRIMMDLLMDSYLFLDTFLEREKSNNSELRKEVSNLEEQIRKLTKD